QRKLEVVEQNGFGMDCGTPEIHVYHAVCIHCSIHVQRINQALISERSIRQTKSVELSHHALR
ncbi:hypothetical protein CHS0354_026713, partial [Potamilus streckersoni]